MEEHPKYNFTAEELRLAARYNVIYQERLSSGLGIASAGYAAGRAVLREVIDSPENIQTSGGAFRAAANAIEDGTLDYVAQMYDEAYANNAAFDAPNSL